MYDYPFRGSGISPGVLLLRSRNRSPRPCWYRSSRSRTARKTAGAGDRCRRIHFGNPACAGVYDTLPLVCPAGRAWKMQGAFLSPSTVNRAPALSIIESYALVVARPRSQLSRFALVPREVDAYNGATRLRGTRDAGERRCVHERAISALVSGILFRV